MSDPALAVIGRIRHPFASYVLPAAFALASAIGVFSSISFAAEAPVEDPPVFSGPTTPAKAPQGIKVGIISCAATLRGCQAPSDAAAEAAKAIGWEVMMYDGKANPKTQATAVLDALSAGAKVIITESIDYRSLQLPLKEAKKLGVPVVSAGVGGDTPNPLPKLEPGQLAWEFAVDKDNKRLGEILGDWIVKDSGGKANIVVYVDLEFESNILTNDGILGVLKKCSGCTVNESSFTASQISTNLGQQVVGFLRTHPDINYVFAPYDPAAFAMVAAIRQAGMGDRIRLVSLLGDEENLDLIRKGDIQVADGAYDLEYSGWATIDQVIRYLNKQPLFDPHSENFPLVVLDKTNLPDGGAYKSPNGFREKYLELWK